MEEAPPAFAELEERRREGRLQRWRKGRHWCSSPWIGEWFVVSAEFLVSFASRTGGQVQSCVFLAAVTAVEPCKKGNAFRICYAPQLGHAPCDLTLELKLRAGDAQEMQRWITAISMAQDARRKDVIFVPLSTARERVVEAERSGAELVQKAKQEAETELNAERTREERARERRERLVCAGVALAQALDAPLRRREQCVLAELGDGGGRCEESIEDEAKAMADRKTAGTLAGAALLAARLAASRTSRLQGGFSRLAVGADHDRGATQCKEEVPEMDLSRGKAVALALCLQRLHRGANARAFQVWRCKSIERSSEDALARAAAAERVAATFRLSAALRAASSRRLAHALGELHATESAGAKAMALASENKRLAGLCSALASHRLKASMKDWQWQPEVEESPGRSAAQACAATQTDEPAPVAGPVPAPASVPAPTPVPSPAPVCCCLCGGARMGPPNQRTVEAQTEPPAPVIIPAAGPLQLAQVEGGLAGAVQGETMMQERLRALRTPTDSLRISGCPLVLGDDPVESGSPAEGERGWKQEQRQQELRGRGVWCSELRGMPRATMPCQSYSHRSMGVQTEALLNLEEKAGALSPVAVSCNTGTQTDTSQEAVAEKCAERVWTEVQTDVATSVTSSLDVWTEPDDTAGCPSRWSSPREDAHSGLCKRACHIPGLPHTAPASESELFSFRGCRAPSYAAAEERLFVRPPRMEAMAPPLRSRSEEPPGRAGIDTPAVRQAAAAALAAAVASAWPGRQALPSRWPAAGPEQEVPLTPRLALRAESATTVSRGRAGGRGVEAAGKRREDAEHAEVQPRGSPEREDQTTPPPPPPPSPPPQQQRQQRQQQHAPAPAELGAEPFVLSGRAFAEVPSSDARKASPSASRPRRSPAQAPAGSQGTSSASCGAEVLGPRPDTKTCARHPPLTEIEEGGQPTEEGGQPMPSLPSSPVSEELEKGVWRPAPCAPLEALELEVVSEASWFAESPEGGSHVQLCLEPDPLATPRELLAKSRKRAGGIGPPPFVLEGGQPPSHRALKQTEMDAEPPKGRGQLKPTGSLATVVEQPGVQSQGQRRAGSSGQEGGRAPRSDRACTEHRASSAAATAAASSSSSSRAIGHAEVGVEVNQVQVQVAEAEEDTASPPSPLRQQDSCEERQRQRHDESEELSPEAIDAEISAALDEDEAEEARRAHCQAYERRWWQSLAEVVLEDTPRNHVSVSLASSPSPAAATASASPTGHYAGACPCPCPCLPEQQADESRASECSSSLAGVALAFSSSASKPASSPCSAASQASRRHGQGSGLLWQELQKEAASTGSPGTSPCASPSPSPSPARPLRVLPPRLVAYPPEVVADLWQRSSLRAALDSATEAARPRHPPAWGALLPSP